MNVFFAMLTLLFYVDSGFAVMAWLTLLPAIGLLWCLGWLS